MATKLALLLCLSTVAFAAEDETVWFEPKTWTGPGVLPEELREDVTTIDWDDTTVSRRRNMGSETSELPPTDIPSPSKWKEQTEQVLSVRSMPKQKVQAYDEKASVPLEKHPIRRYGAYPPMEAGPNWLGMLGSFGSDEETRRQAPSVVVNEEKNVDNSKDESQLNRALEVENTEAEEKQSLKALPEEKQAEVDISTWQRPNCVCVRRMTESPIQTSRRDLDGSGTRVVYQRRKSTSIKCSCSSDAMTKMLQTPHDTRKEMGLYNVIKRTIHKTRKNNYDLSGSEYSGELSDADVLEIPEEHEYDDENEYVDSDEEADIYIYRKSEPRRAPAVGSKTMKLDKNAKLGSQKVKNPRADVDAKTYDGSGEGNIYIYHRADNQPQTLRSRTTKRGLQKLKNPRVDADAEADAEIAEDELTDNNDADYDEVYVSPRRRESFTDRTLRRSDVTDQPPIDPRSIPQSKQEAFTDRSLRRSDVTDQPPIDPRSIPQSRREAVTDRSLRRSDVTDQSPTDPRLLQPSRRTEEVLEQEPAIEERSQPPSRRSDDTDAQGQISRQKPAIDLRSEPPSRRTVEIDTPDQRPPIDPRSQPPSRRADGVATAGQTLPIEGRSLPASKQSDKTVMQDELLAYNPRSLRPSRRIVIPEDNNANKTVPRPPFRRRDLRSKRN
ncbi:hypothetical protein TSAR_007427 [Trichomalopsis sarcophagae]|uniref:Uncharacterized protein n=1 Tax=Trichomalopsis sarcophagae TaxID=543379 RepID=A0A232FE34_9HYME|nr:hypothetical protein TSAR_007427 [Trichomalopsis sarcophagae]